MTTLRATIVLCTYNGERFLPAQLDSLLAQTRLPTEVVIADDVSSDGSWALLEAFATRARDAGISVDLQRNAANLGYVGNFSAALQRARGEVVFLCDQDDVWRADKLERMLGEFERRPQLGLLHTDARLVDADGNGLGCSLFEALELTRAELEAEHRGDGFAVLLRRNTVTGATAALRRSLLGGVFPVPPGWVHDEWLAIAISLVAQVDALEWPSIDYRQHGGNQIGMRKRSLAEKIGGVGMPKRAFMALVASRLEGFMAHCHAHALALDGARLADVQARAAHARVRASLPASLLARLPVVLGEWRSGRYRRYGSGLRSLASDLVDRN